MVGAFGFIIVLVLAGMGVLGLLASRVSHPGPRPPALVWFGGCGLALALPLLAGAVAMWVFRGVATPLADVMAAADAVAEGDMSVRVGTDARGEFGRLARSFNHMTEELERADQQRRNLTADVAHELRTPLHIVQGNLEGILDGVYEPTEEHISATLEETRALTRLVDDLRTLSLAEADQLPMTWEPVQAAELLADVRTSFCGQAEAAGVELRIETEEGLPTITADVGRLDQVLGNLIANAIRHTPPGGMITLRAEPTGGGINIIVDDSGEGIPAEDLPFIFDRFWRGDRPRSHTGGAGSGLGLVIARQLVQMHNGQIQVRSELGVGTTFSISLPAEQKGNRQKEA
jgi:two-component system OmpR family sensor kinase/two-component system sensor histidine kinase BaeS